MKPLHYSPQHLGYIVGPSEKDRKIVLLEDINTIQMVLSKKPLNPEQFEEFLEKPLDELQQIVNDQAELLRRKQVIDQAIRNAFENDDAN